MATAFAFTVLATHVPAEVDLELPLAAAVIEAQGALEGSSPDLQARAYRVLHRAIMRSPHGEPTRKALEVGLALGSKVRAGQPSSTQILLQLGFQHLRLADLDRVAGRSLEAQGHIQAAFDLLVRLRIEGPGHPGEANFSRSIQSVQSLLRTQSRP